MKTINKLARAINTLPRHTVGIFGMPDDLNIAADSVENITGCKDIFSTICKGILSITDKANPAQKPYTLNTNDIISWDKHDDGIDLYMGYGEIISLMLFPA